MEFQLLGPLEVGEEGRTLPIGGPKQRAVLAHLLLEVNRVVSIDRLIEAIWGEEPPETARNTVQTYVRHLRRALGAERIQHRSSGYTIVVDPDEVDALRFEALVDEARGRAETDPAAAVEALREAIDLWRGPALDDLADQASFQPAIARLEELRMAAVEERIGAELDLGHTAELVPELETLVGAHPLRERLRAHLMVALYRSGRQADALAAYRRARELLLDELGIDPSQELQRLHEQILRQDLALEIAGEPLRGYRLLEQIGAGAFGSVHRAFQPQVGREVAVKVIHARFANAPEFIRRFEAEAQFVARLEHPHVVPLYDFWREPEGAYLVMRYLRGGSLREALARGSMAPADAASLLDQIAPALGAAHRQGVVHRDVKPANILFDEEGNAYLSDFGIAKDLATAEAAAPGGTPSPLAYYLSPEEIRGEQVTPATDIYGLGILLYETLAGRHPFAGTPPAEVLEKHLIQPVPSVRAVRPDLPAAVEEVIARATAKDPAERHPEAIELAAAFRDALVPAAGRPVSVAVTEAGNPYKGLRPFYEADAPDFFGREALVAELLARLADAGPSSRFLGVVGPSGSGKSSVVLAGLIPALRSGALQGSAGWFVLDMHPGTQPFEEYQAALMRIATKPAPGLEERLERDDAGLVRAAEEVLPAGTELLLVIDQFEELFTLVHDEDLRARFVAALHTAVTDPRSRLRVLVTLRADFYDRPLSYPGLAELVKNRTVTVTPLVPEELERAVSGPAERVRVTVDPSLLADLAAEVSAQPGVLPLVQYALTELFDRRKDSTLTSGVYREIGGVAGALVRRAESLYGRLGQAGKQATRQLFLRLVTLGEKGSEDTRRRVLRAELTSLEGDPEAMQAAIDAFGARRLLSFDRDPVTRGPTVEVAHEALLREWGRLRGWIEGAREDVRSHRRLATTAREWVDSGRDPGYLLGGARLARSEAWAATSGFALSADERAYLDASLARRQVEREEEEARAGRERALERRALEQVRVSAARELAAAAVANLDIDPERSILLALEAVDVTWEAEGTVVPEAEEALHRALRRSRVVLTVPQGGGNAVSADGARFGTTGHDGSATVWELGTGQRLLTLSGHQGAVNDIAFSPDGSRVATTGSDGTVRVWDGATGREIHVLRGHEGVVWSPVFSPDGSRLATSGEDATVRIWDVAAGTEEMVLIGPEGEPFESERGPVVPAFSPDGSRLASGKWGDAATVWDVATGEIVIVLMGHEEDVTGVAFSPDGSQVATASMDTTARTWDAGSGEHLTTLSGHTGQVRAVAYSPDGSRIATGGSEATARVWDASTGRELLTLSGHTAPIEHLAFTPDGDRLLTGGADGTTRLWDIGVGGGRDWLTVPGPSLRLGGVAFSPDGSSFAVPGDRVGVTIRDVDTGAEVTTLEGHDATIASIVFSPDGGRLAAASGSGRGDPEANSTVPLWDVNTGELLMTLTGHEGPVSAVAFSPDGERLATGSWDGTVRMWDAVTGRQQGLLELGFPTGAVAFSLDGRTLATGTDEEGGVLTVWDADTLQKLGELSGHTSWIQVVAFALDGRAVTASGDGSARIWEMESGRELMTLRVRRGAVWGVAFSPDGARVATVDDDGTARLWDAATGREVLTLYGHDMSADSVAFSPDGRLLATASIDGTVALYLLPIDEVRELARDRVTRTLTDEECRQYLHLETCPQRS